MPNDYEGFWPRLVALLKSLFVRQKTPRHYLIVEVEKPIIGAGDEAAIASLKFHAGHLALMQRLRTKRALLKAHLLNTKQKDIRDVDFLQAGICWMNFLESEVEAAIGSLKRAQEPLSVTAEVETFEQIKRSIESVGNKAA